MFRMVLCTIMKRFRLCDIYNVNTKLRNCYYLNDHLMNEVQYTRLHLSVRCRCNLLLINISSSHMSELITFLKLLHFHIYYDYYYLFKLLIFIKLCFKDLKIYFFRMLLYHCMQIFKYDMYTLTI